MPIGTISALRLLHRQFSHDRAGTRAQRLFRRIFERLRPGGVFLLKELDPTSRLKIGWARVQEALNDRLLGITLGSGFIHETPAEVRARLEAIGFGGVRAVRIDRGYPHPHVLYVARKE